MARRIADASRSVKPWRVAVHRPPSCGAVNTVGFYDPRPVVSIEGGNWRSYARHPNVRDAKRMALAAIGRTP